jgi:hypothetical protein
MAMTRDRDEDWNEPDLPSWMFDADEASDDENGCLGPRNRGGWVPGRGTFALRGVSVLDEIIGRSCRPGTEPERVISRVTSSC